MDVPLGVSMVFPFPLFTLYGDLLSIIKKSCWVILVLFFSLSGAWTFQVVTFLPFYGCRFFKFHICLISCPGCCICCDRSVNSRGVHVKYKGLILNFEVRGSISSLRERGEKKAISLNKKVNE